MSPAPVWSPTGRARVLGEIAAGQPDGRSTGIAPEDPEHLGGIPPWARASLLVVGVGVVYGVCLGSLFC